MANTDRPVITGRHGVLSAGHFLATAAGERMFAKGGNAIDAGVAAGFALTVVKPMENSMGGECPILIYAPGDKKVYAISGQGAAPKKASIQWFRDNGIDLIPGDGYLGATVPALCGSYCAALSRFGRLTLKDVLEPAIDLAEAGFPIYEDLRATIETHAEKFRNEWPSTAEIFLPDGKVPLTGQLVKQPALANTFKRMIKAEETHSAEGRSNAIDHAAAYFYHEIADDILDYTLNFPVKDVTGEYHLPLLEKEDFTNHRTKIEEPIHAKYKRYEIYKCNTWSQGAVFLQQLKLLEGFDLREMGHNSSQYIHTVVECAKLAFADRERYYGDPLFHDVPLDRLFSEGYNEERRKSIDPAKANNAILWEVDEVDDGGTYSGDTTHLDAADSDGFMMSAMPSGAWIPASPIIPKLGFPLGTRGQQFNLKEGHPNCLQPGKRPRITLTPTLSFRDGRPWMCFGTPGGDMQDQWSLQYFLNVTEFDMDLQQAAEQPFFYTNHFPNSFYPKNFILGTVFVEEKICMQELQKLQAKGHSLNILNHNHNGPINAVRFNYEMGSIEGAASPKYDGLAYAMGW